MQYNNLRKNFLTESESLDMKTFVKILKTMPKNCYNSSISRCIPVLSILSNLIRMKIWEVSVQHFEVNFYQKQIDIELEYVIGISYMFITSDSKNAPYHWRNELNFTEVQNIQEKCR